MADSALVALLGLLAVTELVAVLWLGMLVWRHTEQIRHLGAVTRRLSEAWGATSGHEIRVDSALLGGEPDEVAPDGSEDWSTMPSSVKPWTVTDA